MAENTRDWRCTCGRLLAKVRGDRVHIQFARGDQYLVGPPATAICRKCGALNELATTAVVQRSA